MYYSESSYIIVFIENVQRLAEEELAEVFGVGN
jgi:hypothetical protein